MARSTLILLCVVMGLIAKASAAGPSMGRGTKQECKKAFKCYEDVCVDDPDKEDDFRDCFFDCLDNRIKSDDKDFRKDVEKVYDWCKDDKRPKDAPEGKVLKCTLHKVKKDACRWYFRDERD